MSACLAYCLGRMNQHSEAIQFNEEALARGFADPEIVYNNLAYNQLALGHEEEAAKILERLLTLAPDLPAAQHNRVYLHRLALRLGKKNDLLAARNDLQRALAICPPSAELFGDAADLCAAAGHFDSAWNTDALSYLEKAVPLGLVLGNRPKNALYKNLHNDPRFKALEKSSSPVVTTGPSHRLIDPLRERPPDR